MTEISTATFDLLAMETMRKNEYLHHFSAHTVAALMSKEYHLDYTPGLRRRATCSFKRLLNSGFLEWHSCIRMYPHFDSQRKTYVDFYNIKGV